MIGLSLKDRIGLTISEIEYSDEYEDNWELFNDGIEILRNHELGTEFSDEDREVGRDFHHYIFLNIFIC